MSVRVVSLAFATAVILSAQTDQCLIRGEVTDAAHAVIPKTVIRVFAKESMSLVFRGNADEDGTFCIKALSPGTYMVKAWSDGFRANSVHDVVTGSRETSDVGTIQLEIGSCDARHVDCDLFSTPKTFPAKPATGVIRAVVRADLHLPRACGADLDNGKAVCPQSKGFAKNTDVIFTDEHDALFLRPANGAQIDPDCKGAYRDQALRIDGLGEGDDLCIVTRKGHISRIFFEDDDVQPNTNKLNLWMVTR